MGPCAPRRTKFWSAITGGKLTETSIATRALNAAKKADYDEIFSDENFDWLQVGGRRTWTKWHKHNADVPSKEPEAVEPSPTEIRRWWKPLRQPAWSKKTVQAPHAEVCSEEPEQPVKPHRKESKQKSWKPVGQPVVDRVPEVVVDDMTKIPHDLYMALLSAADAKENGQHIFIGADESDDRQAHLILVQGVDRSDDRKAHLILSRSLNKATDEPCEPRYFGYF